MKLREVAIVAKESVSDFVADSAPQQAAALAFYTILSLAPLLLLTVAIAGAVADEGRVRDEILAQFQGLMGEQGRRFVAGVLDYAGQPERGLRASIIGAGVIIIAATGAFSQLKMALNAAWDVRPIPGATKWYGVLRRLIVNRLLSFAMILVIAFLLLASLVISALLAGFGTWASDLLPAGAPVLRVVNLVATFLLITVLFALLFKYMPDARVGWREVWLGAALTSLLFSVGKFGIGLYLGRSTIASPYGAAGSVVLVLLWVYYSAMILLLGAEITQQTARHLGKAIRPAEGFEIVRVAEDEPGAKRRSRAA